jgi:hypothetical protein
LYIIIIIIIIISFGNQGNERYSGEQGQEQDGMEMPNSNNNNNMQRQQTLSCPVSETFKKIHNTLPATATATTIDRRTNQNNHTLGVRLVDATQVVQ